MAIDMRPGKLLAMQNEIDESLRQKVTNVRELGRSYDFAKGERGGSGRLRALGNLTKTRKSIDLAQYF